ITFPNGTFKRRISVGPTGLDVKAPVDKRGDQRGAPTHDQGDQVRVLLSQISKELGSLHQLIVASPIERRALLNEQAYKVPVVPADRMEESAAPLPVPAIDSCAAPDQGLGSPA